MKKDEPGAAGTFAQSQDVKVHVHRTPGEPPDEPGQAAPSDHVGQSCLPWGEPMYVDSLMYTIKTLSSMDAQQRVQILGRSFADGVGFCLFRCAFPFFVILDVVLLVLALLLWLLLWVMPAYLWPCCAAGPLRQMTARQRARQGFPMMVIIHRVLAGLSYRPAPTSGCIRSLRSCS
eukprot:g47129.t1